ncbi:hypothetical protein [uncultured Ruminococcus sp.]|uniref:hypothetical protein n=1 Tax=uncultured Ruminococcus sp. TaxID=165186 RepID=UPI0025F13B59|nr:hypothetical protein [uncultured Ruminococcus sp.]
MADNFTVDDSVFIKVDTAKITAFLTKAPTLVEEFENIKKDFEKINSDILGEWQGEGADEYKYETDHILEKIGDLAATIKEITEGTLTSVRDEFVKQDTEIGNYNRKMANDEE